MRSLHERHAYLGLVVGDVYTRDGTVTEAHRDRQLAERESRGWIDTAERAKDVLASPGTGARGHAAAMVTW